jgi:hypothetical protein
MPAPDDASDALRQAISALETGHWDRRSQEGARLNALDSIAWSLIGILGHLEGKAPGAQRAAPKPQSRKRHFDDLELSPLKPSA